MKISELIKMLKLFRDVHGDLDVETLVGYGRKAARPPRLAFRSILTKRQRTPRFWSFYADSESQKGEPVCRLD